MEGVYETISRTLSRYLIDRNLLDGAFFITKNYAIKYALDSKMIRYRAW